MVHSPVLFPIEQYVIGRFRSIKDGLGSGGFSVFSFLQEKITASIITSQEYFLINHTLGSNLKMKVSNCFMILPTGRFKFPNGISSVTTIG
jgi:hypothetical protein